MIALLMAIAILCGLGDLCLLKMINNVKENK
jgi:hypothetical protein